MILFFESETVPCFRSIQEFFGFWMIELSVYANIDIRNTSSGH
jgi:hypothetical protein